MATCAIEDLVLRPIYCQTTNTMKKVQSSSFEKNNQQCPVNFHMNCIQMDSTTSLRNSESTKKRLLNRSNTYNAQTTRLRPTTLFSRDSTSRRPIPLFRTCFSHPSTSPNTVIPIDNSEFSPAKFTSLPVLTSPPTKRLRSPTLSLVSKNISIPNISETVSTLFSSTSSSSISFIDSSELVNKLKENFQIIIFDCGSPIRYSENHICNSNLLRVSDRISRKRLKTNPTKYSTIDLKQLNEYDFVILYDDHSDNHHELSPGLKCACEEIQRFFTTTKHPEILVLKNSFDDFLNLYPHLCKSFQSHSSSSINDSSLQSTPILPNLDVQNYPMTHIIDGVFIGSESNAKNIDELFSEQIRHIINVTSHVPSYHLDQFHYYHIPADDTHKQNLLDYFDQAYTFIYNAIENHEKVLVHCVAGISRSPAIVIGFLMRYAHMNMDDAYEFVKQKRSIVSPNLNFMGQLLQYEKNLREQK
ncbi:unnamed protein product [Rotaria sp. Silwood1]|nr:unnamed protein product [Rotaria sp. Silwood1]CAF0746895.1 unnamed protein product [Rotaria sp. Silwood1]CAF3347987.1 unnamed protein product [Rotaria sp. Silwood1]CAF4541630.1 unnamed protein product [Rotaria sp. Silwood1]